MSRATTCPACGSELYGKVMVYVGDNKLDSLTMQELDDSEVKVVCDNDDYSVNRSDLTPRRQERIEEFSDRVVGFLARANAAESYLAEVASAMSGHEWNADTMDRVAQIIRDAGFEIADYEPPELSAS